MKLTKTSLAVAALAAIAGGSAFAGNFQTNSTAYAREVIVGDAQTITAPQATYSFSGPVRNPTQQTYFQIQLTLSAGEWVVPSTSGFPASNAVGNVALVDGGGTVIATAYGQLLDSNNKNVLYATFQIAPGAVANGASVVWNANSTGLPDAANVLKVKKLKGLVGTVGSCDTSIVQLTGSVKQYPNITDPTFVATDANSPSTASEHVLNGSQNAGPIISFPTNLKLSGTANGTTALQDYATGAKKFNAATAVSALTVALGTVTYTKPANGYDTDGKTVYGTPAATVVATAVGNVGAPELKNYSVTLTGNFASTGKVWLSKAACADAGYATGVAPTNGSVTVTDALAADLAVGTAINVCYGVDGTSQIPTSPFAASLVLNKAPDNAGDVATRYEEQNNSCTANFRVGGGIQIDVRNYVSAKTGGATSMVRLINNSETNTADIFAQMIYANGTYGAWGQLDSLKPREAANWVNSAIDAKLTNAPAGTDPFGLGTGNYTTTSGSAVVVAPKGASVGDRLRIVSTTGSTLRVQSYMILGNQILNVSDSQGVDFEDVGGVGARTISPGNDGQAVFQDAIKGLAR